MCLFNLTLIFFRSWSNSLWYNDVSCLTWSLAVSFADIPPLPVVEFPVSTNYLQYLKSDISSPLVINVLCAQFYVTSEAFRDRVYVGKENCSDWPKLQARTELARICWININCCPLLRPRVSLHPLEADCLLPGRLPDCEDWWGDLWHHQHEAKRQEQRKQSVTISSILFDWKRSASPLHMLIVSILSDSLLCWFAERPGLHHRHRLQGSAVWDVEDIRVQDALEAPNPLSFLVLVCL